MRAEQLPSWPHLSEDLQEEIAFFELLAQACLVYLRAQSCGCASWRCAVRHWCDNTPAVGAIQKLFSTREPLCWALQALAFHASRAQVEVVAQYLPGKENVWADRMSRAEEFPAFIASLSPDLRRTITLREILDPVWK